jgi:hypothetical protein
MTDYKESTGNFWKPEKEGEQIEGLLTEIERNVGPNSSTIYYIEKLDNNEVVQIWGTTVLDMRMKVVKVGQQVLITYKGLSKEKPKGGKQAPHIWKVEYKDPDDIVQTAKDEFDVKE